MVFFYNGMLDIQSYGWIIYIYIIINQSFFFSWTLGDGTMVFFCQESQELGILTTSLLPAILALSATQGLDNSFLVLRFIQS
jgi:hypothetical protein